MSAISLAVLIVAAAIIVFLISLTWVGWTIFPSFGTLRKSIPTMRREVVEITPGVPLANIGNRHQKEANLIALGHHLYPRIEDEISDAHTEALNQALLLLVVALLAFLLAQALGVQGFDLFAMFAFFLGGSELLVLAIAMFKLAVLARQVKALIASGP